jgi:nucleotide-binding universal stress UspA family protein
VVRHILCAVDFSRPSEFALTYAALMAKKLGARLTAMHAFELMSDIFPDDASLDRDAIDTAVRHGIDAQLKDMVTRCAQGVPIERHLAEGVAYRTIVGEADRLGADLIIVGTHGRTGLPHLLLGSVARRVVRTARVPVLTARAPKSEAA